MFIRYPLYMHHTRTSSDALCGRLQCATENEVTIYGSSSVVSTAYAYLNQGAKRYTQCRVAMYEFGESALDTEPGLAPDGATCGVDKVAHLLYVTNTELITDVLKCEMCACVGRVEQQQQMCISEL
jgi:hypothetical protein